MYGKIKEHLQQELAEIEAAGLYKKERIITSPQRAEIEVAGRPVLNFCANNYLGLSDNKRLIEAAKRTMDARGFGMSSVRFICGCQDIHKELERAIADYFGTEDTILYAACFDANGGVFEPLFTQEDAIISDALNHASIIDGVRLCKAVRYRYANADMAELEECLKQAQAQRYIIEDGSPQQIRVLQQQRHFPARVVSVAVIEEFAGKGALDKSQKAQQSGLAAAVGAGQRHGFAAFNGQGELRQSRPLLVALLQIPGFIDGAHARAPRRRRKASARLTRKAMKSSTSPRAMPEKAPPKNPLQDLPSPKILFPLQDLPKSILVSPPKTTAAEFGTMAGRKSHRPVNIMAMTPTTSMDAPVG